MVRFLNSYQKNPEVEDVMRDINNYINYNDSSVLSTSLQPNVRNDFQHLILLTTNVNNDYTLSPYTPTIANGKLRKVKGFLKKIIRKSVCWYLKDICNQQTCINANIIRVLNEQNVFLSILLEENKQLKERVDAMQKSFIESDKEN